MFFKGPHLIKNLYDSHVHWMYSGQVYNTWSLKGLNPKQILNIELTEKMRRGHWIVGFGWDESNWGSDFNIHRQFLDIKYPDVPVFLSRTDGHSSWLNTAALKEMNLWKQYTDQSDIEVDNQGWPTGKIREKAHISSLQKLPAFSLEQKKQHLIAGAQMFNQSGFSHIRDMTSSSEQWKLNRELLDKGLLSLHVEHWFVSESLSDLPNQICEAVACKKEQSSMMKMRGIKIFVDGSLGSHTAFLSENYAGLSHQGQMNWSEADIETAIRSIWNKQLEVALHCLGDEAVDRVVKIARKIYSSGLQGQLHLEHVEIIKPETIQLMKPLHVRCHLQPCHWESDRQWLMKKLPQLWKMSFPWSALEKAKVPMSFGSDCPIEPSNFFQNLVSLMNAEKAGIANVCESVLNYHTYPYNDSPLLLTEIVDDEIIEVRLNQ